MNKQRHAAVEVKSPENNWRKTHQELINTIRAARQIQIYVNKGGDIRDLPQPPPSENSDYIQCPHCLRRFNEAAANRHIPKCADYEYNKPKKPGNPKWR
ncbi:unnamed protein product [Plutella xylostella]|uniref:(diamondback moth) hypothetical protein n=1 Tax=Plutella xylostella TaxID=51655 RepID=A0A8S4FT35_PLUXY|nr:unnamed protein product [Plutella xylostella]